jgi:TonB family protein
MNGIVEVDAAVDPNGIVSVKLAKSSDPMFNDAALEAAKQWRWELGLEATRRLTFRFNMLPDGATPARVAIYKPQNYEIELLVARPGAACDECCGPVKLKRIEANDRRN